jgi:hypothetical protein
MANLNKFLSEAKEMLSETKEKKGGGQGKLKISKMDTHLFCNSVYYIYAIIGKHLKLFTPPH